MRRVYLCAALLAGATLQPAEVWALGEPFASRVVAYVPAPGQLVSDPYFNDGGKALGAPEGAGTRYGNSTDVVSLGGFGGFIVLAFDQTVEDDPLNPLGLDAIVFGNAFWVGGDDQRRWAEPAVIEISYDTNGNGIADDAWYLIPGSHLMDLPAQFMEMFWDDDVNDVTYPPEFASWLPLGRTGVWSTSGFMLSGSVFSQEVLLNPSEEVSREGVWGYGDCSPTLLLGDLDADDMVDDSSLSPELFYTTPDDPLTVGITGGSGGGDAFDIAWAVNPDDGSLAALPGFDFIRLTNGVFWVQGSLGEKSPEIDAVADVAADSFGDLDSDDDIDLADVMLFMNCFSSMDATSGPCELADRQLDGLVGSTDSAAFFGRLGGPR